MNLVQFTLHDGRTVFINPLYVIGISDIPLVDEETQQPLPHGPFTRVVTTQENYDIRGEVTSVAKALENWDRVR